MKNIKQDNREIKKWTTEQWEDLDLTFRFIDTVWDDEAQKAYFENVEKLAEKELGHRVKPSWWDYIKNLFNS